MSDKIRLVRCPKCDKVLPEPSDVSIYQCGNCNTILRVRKKSAVSDELVGGSGEVFDKISAAGEGSSSDMGSRSPARSLVGDWNGSKSPLKEGGLIETEFSGGLPKSPMRDRFLNDLGTTPGPSRHASRSPIRERGSSDDFSGNGDSPMRSRNVSRSPLRALGGTSVRTRDVTRSPMREGIVSSDLNGGGKLPARQMVEDFPKSPLRGGLGGSEVESVVEEDQERGRKMAPKASFNEWLSDEEGARKSIERFPERRPRQTGRDQVGDTIDQISEGTESVYSGERRMTPERSGDSAVHGIGRSNGNVRTDDTYRGGNGEGRARTKITVDPRVKERDGFRSSYGTSNVVIEPERYSASSSVVDGYSNSHPDPNYGYGGPGQSFESSRGPSSVQDLQREHAKLARRYRELKDQLGDMDSNSVSSPQFYGRSDDLSVDGSLRYVRSPIQQFPSDRKVLGPSHIRRGSGPVHNVADMYYFNDPTYDDPYASDLRWGARPNQPHLSIHCKSRYGQSLDFDHSSLESFPQGAHGHHPSCTCSHCYSSRWQDQDLPRSSANRMSGNLAANPRTSHSMNLERYGPRGYDPKMAHTAPRQLPSHYGHDYRRRSEVASLNKRFCRPISGGAPFVICHSCFELLILPGKLVSKQKNQYELRCGACSAVMSFDYQKISCGQLPKVMNESGPKHHRHSFAASSRYVGSYDFDATGSSFQSMDLQGQRLSSNLAANIDSPSHPSKDEHVSDTASVRSSQPNSMEMPQKIRPPPGSPLLDHLDYSTQFQVSQAGKASYTLAEKQAIEMAASPEAPLDTTDASETDVHSSEVPTTNLSQDAGDIPSGSPSSGNNKDTKSSLTSLLNFRGLGSGRGSPGGADVCVNGQALSHRLVKKAEKLAGPIQPGEYWYDPKAGFWGVMGHRCLGIIPPFIQEFGFPLQASCSRGDTAVYVNGRELHKKDLDLLASRGLPTMREKSYIIDISGRVLDEGTRDFVVNLGRLAPSVEKQKCGFGMQVPEKLENSQ